MNKKTAVALAGLLGILALVLVPARRAPAEGTRGQAGVQRNPTIMREIAHDASIPLRNMQLLPVKRSIERDRFNGTRRSPIPVKGVGPDPFIQDLGLSTPVSAVIGLNFDGLNGNQAGGVIPPDTEGSPGATQVVEWVNLSYNIYDKATGTSIMGPFPGNQFWSGFSTDACNSSNDGDPIIQYDKAAGRWVAAQFTQLFTTKEAYCVAVSQTDDATGAYNRYAFAFGGSDLPDYPKMAVWPDGYYVSVDDFDEFGFTYLGAKACAMDRNNMLLGNAATMQCFQEPSSDIYMLPSDWDGATAPPTGEPNFFMQSSSTSTADLFKFHVDFTNPTNSTFTGPTAITVTPFTQLCPGSPPPFDNRNCVPEPSPGEKVDGLSDRLQYRLAYRNFGDHEALVASQTVKVSTFGAIRWYEFRNPNGTPTVFQQGTVSLKNTYLWNPSIAMDKVGDIVLGFNEGSSTVKPSIAFTGRLSTDPLNKMEGAKPIVKGGGVQVGGSNRWGDYSDMAIDPSDDCTFWFTEEYYKSGSSANWSTRLTSIKFTGCH